MAKATIFETSSSNKRVRKTTGKPAARRNDHRGHGKLPATVIMAKVGIILKTKGDVVFIPREEVESKLMLRDWKVIKRQVYRKLPDTRSQKKEKKGKKVNK